jgi:hypothetical protein
MGFGYGIFFFSVADRSAKRSGDEDEVSMKDFVDQLHREDFAQALWFGGDNFSRPPQQLRMDQTR